MPIDWNKRGFDLIDDIADNAFRWNKRGFDLIDDIADNAFRWLRTNKWKVARLLLVFTIAYLVVDLVVVYGISGSTLLSRAWDGLAAFLRDTGGAPAHQPAPVHVIIRNLGLLLAGFLGVIFAAWRAVAYDRQTVVAEQGHITDRFNKATELLGSEKTVVRIAAINALWRIGVDSTTQEDKRAVLDVLCGFIRDYTPDTGAQTHDAEGTVEGNDETHDDATGKSPDETRTTPDQAKPKCPPDVQTALDFLGTRRDALKFDADGAGYRLNLSEAHLAGCTLEGYDLKGAILRGADLRHALANEVHLEEADLSAAKMQRALLKGAHLEGAYLGSAHLDGADLWGAHLEKAILWFAHLEGANLENARLEGANLDNARLDRANLRGAHLEGADLENAHLDGANLRGAHLEGAKLGYARLEGADLRGAHLDGARLWYAHLEGAHISDADFRNALELTQAQLDTACWDGRHPPHLPAGFTCPPNYCLWDFIEQEVVSIDPPARPAPCPA